MGCETQRAATDDATYSSLGLGYLASAPGSCCPFFQRCQSPGCEASMSSSDIRRVMRTAGHGGEGSAKNGKNDWNGPHDDDGERKKRLQEIGFHQLEAVRVLRVCHTAWHVDRKLEGPQHWKFVLCTIYFTWLLVLYPPSMSHSATQTLQYCSCASRYYIPLSCFQAHCTARCY